MHKYRLTTGKEAVLDQEDQQITKIRFVAKVLFQGYVASEQNTIASSSSNRTIKDILLGLLNIKLVNIELQPSSVKSTYLFSNDETSFNMSLLIG